MSLFDFFRYDGKRVVVVGAATGMGNAAARLVNLCSDAASAISGITVVSDAGYFSSGLTESFPPATGITNYLSGRT